MSEAQRLASTTAPGKVFSSRSELADHYKSEWHKYNLKRREAGLAMLEEADFQARWEAALALRQENDAQSKAGRDHIKADKKSSKSKKRSTNKDAGRITDKAGGAVSSNPGTGGHAPPTKLSPEAQAHAQRMAESQENPDINPKQSLFDSHKSKTVEQNVEYMRRKFGFFLPDREYLNDLEGLLGYCQEKIKLGHYCLYCEKVFPTWQGCQNHMISKNHTKLRYEKGYWDEVDVFYDFTKDNQGFLGPKIRSKDEAHEERMPKDGGHDGEGEQANESTVVPGEGDSDDDGWEDMSNGSEENENNDDDDDDDDEIYGSYEEEIARFGLDVTPLGELVFPDGRIVGHRALRKYYKQRARPEPSSVAIVAAKHAAGERMHAGQVVNIGLPVDARSHNNGAGRGILVRGKDVSEGFSALSLYRYRAAIRKQRRGDEKGQRIQFKQSMNINKMDKKHNRLMNGVSVAHAAR
eukprot:CAMPEP_0119553504 /NCGR_PEP_ID=MMETSP1352-20130426/6242_1 /TAXON_ID=265584 /ORGANISM="Stauroneis constricta, Strain CCMP1120" /LENGTH=465 /DNA_ID=CAMNT_0007599931 /DNA_START=30 /DNA_END=1427 /DNA_ORIENTATION=-